MFYFANWIMPLISDSKSLSTENLFCNLHNLILNLNKFFRHFCSLPNSHHLPAQYIIQPIIFLLLPSHVDFLNIVRSLQEKLEKLDLYFIRF